MFVRSARTIGIFVRLLLLLSLLFVPAPPVAAAGSTSVHLVKYAADGVTVLSERAIDYTEMESQLPVRGGGTTYYHQGPTFDEEDLWDIGETQNLKNKGAPKGTDLKDLCELVGGMSTGDTVEVKAVDGFKKTFDYANVYNPPDRQGRIVVTWYSDRDGYVPTWGDGMMLVFFAETTNDEGQHVFGHDDMRQTLPENRWHYFDIYPSTNGFSVKNIDKISIFAADGDSPQRKRAHLDVSATVVLPEIGISLNRSEIDYGEVQPGESSSVIDVGISNTGSSDFSVTLELQGSDEVAQEFYERSLYIDDAAYASDATIATVERDQSKNVDTQLKVPPDWHDEGRQDAVLVFWAEAVN
jgi:hypothetical protein